MFRKSIFCLTSIALLNISNLTAFGISFGPFDLRIGEGYTRQYVDDPICRAISEQKKLEFVVKTKEKISDNELNISIKRVIVEPYAFGYNQESQPVLRGTVTDEKLIKEIKVTSTEDEFDRDDRKERSGSFLGFFRSHKADVKSIDLARVSEVRIIEDSHFDAPADLSAIFKDDLARVVCHVVPRK